MNGVQPHWESELKTSIKTLNFSNLVGLTVVLEALERPLQSPGYLVDAIWLHNYSQGGMAQSTRLDLRLHHGAPFAERNNNKGNKMQVRWVPEKAMGRSLYRVPRRYDQKLQQSELL